MILFCIAAFYFGSYYPAADSAVQIARSGSSDITFNNTHFLVFAPDGKTGASDNSSRAAVIFYPGAKIQFESYAPICKTLSDNGILCALVEMPLNFAFFNIDAASDVSRYLKDSYSCGKIYLSGHSLGGAMSCEYAYSHPDELDGLILLAAYSAKDLSNTSLRILSILASNDKVLGADKIQMSRTYMPDDFTEFVISGGCHAFFGDYGLQSGDGTPSISREDQISQTVHAILNWIE